MAVIHGGDFYEYQRRHGRRPLDFSASLNPYGPPPAVLRAAAGAVADTAVYPAPQSRELPEALSRHTGVAAERLMCGNGAVEILYRVVLARRPRRALVVVPTFAEYEQALATVGCRVDHHLLLRENGFRLDNGILDQLLPGVDMLFFCQPNNPTGEVVAPDLLARMRERCAENGTLIFADECFLPFVPESETYSLRPWLESGRGLFLLGSFTKLYGMAGLRLGYGMGDPDLVRAMADSGPPWSVSGIAQAAGKTALAETAFVRRSLDRLRADGQELAAALRHRGCAVWGSRANFLFFHSPVPELAERLLEAGIMIRDCASFRGLTTGFYRVAVRTRGDNERLLRTFDTIMDGH
ncbi:MAG: aminotransferase class I/II-fold pyridoxal phosphate-dependent enzyme [Planctomycetes bacterium]|nr:aminotransferase class I/II-fold pyridoxal phosphate-dependent enzyme [Planctomycetota bacterium]